MKLYSLIVYIVNCGLDEIQNRLDLLRFCIVMILESYNNKYFMRC